MVIKTAWRLDIKKPPLENKQGEKPNERRSISEVIVTDMDVAMMMAWVASQDKYRELMEDADSVTIKDMGQVEVLDQ